MEKTLYEQASGVIGEIIEKAHLSSGDILVIGCSTSEIIGSRIGTNSAPEIAEEVFSAFYDCAHEKNIYLAVQCCEHLNRAIVIEREAAVKRELATGNSIWHELEQEENKKTLEEKEEKKRNEDRTQPIR